MYMALSKGLHAASDELQKAHRLLMLQVDESEKTCDRLTKEVIDFSQSFVPHSSLRTGLKY